MFGDFLSIVAPVFIVAGVGYAIARAGRPFPTETVRWLVFWIGTPCLVFSALTRLELDPDAVTAMAGASAAALAAFAAIAVLLLKLFRLSLSGFLPALTFPNTGNMGLPLALFAFGDIGLALAVTYYTVNTIGQFTLGYGIASGSFNVRQFARNPVIYTVAAALVFLFTGASPPRWIANTTHMVGGMAIPLLLLTLGNALARLRVGDLRISVAISAVRLAMGFAVGVALAALMGLEGAVRGVFILQSSMPVAVFSYLFAQQADSHPEEVAGTVLVSTGLSLATLPALLWYLL